MGLNGRRVLVTGGSQGIGLAILSGDIFAVDEARWREAWDLKVYGYVNRRSRT